MGKKSRVSPGTWVERELFQSPAYLELSGFAPQLLLLFLGKRDISRDHTVKNKNSLTMTYVELENFYVRNEDRSPGLPRGISRPRIIRALDNLMAHGFIKIVRRGGAYQQDKTVYGLCEDWRWWRPGAKIHSREPDCRQRGYNGKTKLAHETVPIHTHETVTLNRRKRGL